MGVTTSILSDTVIQSKAVLAEALIKKAVTTYADIITAGSDTATFLESACIAQLGVLLCPGMPNRIKTSETSETGYSYKLQDIDWVKRKNEMEELMQSYIDLATGGTVEVPFSLVGVVNNTRIEIDYESGD